MSMDQIWQDVCRIAIKAAEKRNAIEYATYTTNKFLEREFSLNSKFIEFLKMNNIGKHNGNTLHIFHINDIITEPHELYQTVNTLALIDGWDAFAEALDIYELFYYE